MNKFYVYMYLREDGTPYYVGKGKGKRAYSPDRTTPRPSKDKIVFPYTNLTEEESFQREKELIAEYGRKDNGTGILRNLTDGGEGASGVLVSEETRKKISLAGKNPSAETIEKRKRAFAGYKHSPESRAKITEGQLKRFSINPFSDETKKKISQTSKGRKLSPETKARMSQSRMGMKISEERRKKISQSLMGRKLSPEHKEKLSKSHLGKLIGYKHSPESIEKMRQAQLGKKQSPEHVEKNRKKSLGTKHTPETKAKMSLAQRKRRNKQSTGLDNFLSD
jgi:hypothetical protein